MLIVPTQPVPNQNFPAARDRQPYTYVHRRLDTGDVFYVGKGTGYRAKGKNGRNKHWWAIVRKHGFCVEIVSLWPTDEQAYQHEIELIAAYKAAGVYLCNYGTGGEGGGAGRIQSEEERAKRSAIQTEVWKRPEFRAFIVPKLKGRKFSEEAKRRPRKKPSPMSDETRAKMSAAQVVLNNMPWRKAFNSALHKGRKMGDQTKRRISLTKTGKPNKLSRTVLCVQTSLKFPTLACATRWVIENGATKASSAAIQRACIGKVRTAYGFEWRFQC